MPRNSPDGISWPTPAITLDAVPVGHQWTPDISSAGGVINVVFYDSRADPAYSPSLPPGDTAGGTNSGDVVNTFVAKSVNGGASWSETQISTQGSNFNWETHGSRRDPFWGDYIYISAVGGTMIAAWTDSRDLVPGTDPRETGADDDQDGFDVYQPCTYVPNDINAGSYSSPLISDPCLSQGGLDQNIYAASGWVRGQLMASARVLARALAPTRDLRRGKSDQPRLSSTAEGFRASADRRVNRPALVTRIYGCS